MPRFWVVVSLPRAPPPSLAETPEQTQGGGGVSEVESDGGGWAEKVHAGDEEKRTHGRQQELQQAAPPAAPKRARLPPGRCADLQEATRGGEKEKEVVAMTADLKKKTQGGYSSEFAGVSWIKEWNKWCAQRRITGKVTQIGYYAKEEDAARAYNDFAQHGTRNGIVTQAPSSRFRGVSWNKNRGKWTAQFRDETGTSRHLGSF
jgi:hypothetical protein